MFQGRQHGEAQHCGKAIPTAALRVRFVRRSAAEHRTASTHDLRRVPDFSQGRYRGALEEVQQNILKFGDADVCMYLKGWFEQTMPQFAQPIVAAYIDVDLVSSTSARVRNARWFPVPPPISRIRPLT